MNGGPPNERGPSTSGGAGTGGGKQDDSTDAPVFLRDGGDETVDQGEDRSGDDASDGESGTDSQGDSIEPDDVNDNGEQRVGAKADSNSATDEEAEADENADDSGDEDDSPADQDDLEVPDRHKEPGYEQHDDFGLEGPPDDEELPITEHIEEMLHRLAVVLVVAGAAAAIAIPWTSDIIIHMWYDIHTGTVAQCLETPQDEGCAPPHVYSPLEFVLMRLRVAGLAGLVVALPVTVYETYRFMRPGLYPNERRYYLAAVPMSLVLGVIGVLFAYFVLLPILFIYFIGYSEATQAVELAFQLQDTLNLMLLMMGLLAVIFQIPLLMMLGVMMGITSREWLAGRRLYFWAGFLGVAFLFGPDPTGMAPILLSITMVILFEGTLLLLKWTGR